MTVSDLIETMAQVGSNEGFGDTLRARWKARAELAAKREDAAERAKIAAAFNDRYTYRKQLVPGMPIPPGTYYGTPHRSGYAWMCPDCNKAHHPTSDSVWTGLQYPECCATAAGARLNQGIRTQ